MTNQSKHTFTKSWKLKHASYFDVFVHELLKVLIKSHFNVFNVIL